MVRGLLENEVTLLELIDRLLDKGVVLTGDITLSVADVDLIRIGLRLLIGSVAATERLHEDRRSLRSSDGSSPKGLP